MPRVFAGSNFELITSYVDSPDSSGSNRGSTLSFDGGLLYSYRTLIAVYAGGGLFLVNVAPYSHTTSTHVTLLLDYLAYTESRLALELDFESMRAAGIDPAALSFCRTGYHAARPLIVEGKAYHAARWYLLSASGRLYLFLYDAGCPFVPVYSVPLDADPDTIYGSRLYAGTASFYGGTVLVPVNDFDYVLASRIAPTPIRLVRRDALIPNTAVFASYLGNDEYDNLYARGRLYFRGTVPRRPSSRRPSSTFHLGNEWHRVFVPRGVIFVTLA